MKPSALGCIGTLVVSYLLLALAVLYLGVAIGTLAVLAVFLFIAGSGANLAVRVALGLPLGKERGQSVSAGRVSLAVVFLIPPIAMLGSLPLALAQQSESFIWPMIVWFAVLFVSAPSYYWMYFANEVPWLHWKIKLPFSTEKAMRKEEKVILGWWAWLFRLGQEEPDELGRQGHLKLGEGIQASPALLRRDHVLDAKAREAHVHVLGKPGTGKSRALESWIMQDIVAGRGVGVVDPHGELFDHILSRVAKLTEEQPALAERIVIINPLDPTWTVGFNPLEAIPGISSERLALFLRDVVVKVWQIETAEAPRMIRLLTFTFLALIELHLGLAELPRFLTDEDWREELLPKTNNLEVIRYFRFEFPTTGGAAHQWYTPVLNKVGELLLDEDVRLIFSSKSTIDFRAMMDRGLVLLVNLSKGHLAEGNSALLGAFIVAHLQKSALARPEHSRPFYLYLDEFQNYTTDNIKNLLEETRKYHLWLVLAHQHLDQLSGDLLKSVVNATGTLACFRVSYQNASVLSNEMFPPGYLEEPQGDVKFLHIGRALLPIPSEEKETLAHAELASLLTQLRDREFWVKESGPHMPNKQRTFTMPDPEMNAKLMQLRVQLIETSGQRYGRLKEEVVKETAHEREQLIKQLGGKLTEITDYEPVQKPPLQKGEQPAADEAHKPRRRNRK